MYRALPLEPPRRRRLGWRVFKWTVILAVWGSVALGLALLWFACDLPRPEAALDAARRPSLTLQDRTGHIYRQLRRRGRRPAAAVRHAALPAGRGGGGGGPPVLGTTRLDLIGIARAVWVNLTAGRLVQGGSTITQQVAKNLFLTNARTVRRKVQELLLTLWLERTFTKKEILEIYLNRVYLGSGAWGMDAAARIYFGVSARKVTLWQAAVLAGLPRAPSRFNPRVDPAAAAARASEVLAAMVDTGVLKPEQAQAAAAQIVFPPTPSVAGYFADWVAEQAQTQLEPGADAVLRTTLDSRLQSIVEAKLAALLDGPGAAAQVTQGAVVVLDAATGAVRAMAGGADYRTSPYNRAVLARRQPGSSFKPFVWAAALEAGMRARRHRAGRADPGGQLGSFGLRGAVPRRGDDGGRAGPVAQHRVGPPAAARRRPDGGGGDGAPAGHCGDPAEQRHRWRSAPPMWACWKWPEPMRRSSTAATG